MITHALVYLKGHILKKSSPLFLGFLSLSLLFSLFIPTVGWAKATIQVLAERPAISLKQVLSVSVEVSISNGSIEGELIEPNWNKQGWSRLGRSQSTQMQFVNGRQSMQLVYQYQLRPTRVGSLKIGPFKGTGSLKNLRSNVETVQVSEKAPKLSKQQIEEQNKYAFLKWEVDEKEVWLGQAIKAKLVLYVNRQLRLTRFPLPEINLKDFWIQEVEEPQKRAPKVRVNGYVYQKRRLKSLCKGQADGACGAYAEYELVGFGDTNNNPQAVPTFAKVKAHFRSCAAPQLGSPLQWPSLR